MIQIHTYILHCLGNKPFNSRGNFLKLKFLNPASCIGPLMHLYDYSASAPPLSLAVEISPLG